VIKLLTRLVHRLLELLVQVLAQNVKGVFLGAHFELKSALVLLAELPERGGVEEILVLVPLHYDLRVFGARQVLVDRVVGDVD